jgi:hypothetical protein
MIWQDIRGEPRRVEVVRNQELFRRALQSILDFFHSYANLSLRAGWRFRLLGFVDAHGNAGHGGHYNPAYDRLR